MMLFTKEPLASIALACGLADQSHLTRLFRRVVGVSPASWRRLRAARCCDRARRTGYRVGSEQSDRP
jgi:AraC-like DNA-binding protein